jgi:hypothetical protein
MSAAQLQAHLPQDTDEAEELSDELEFREWCKANNEDPENEDSREHYQTIQSESSWDSLDENDKAGWWDNMTKGSDD